MLLLPYADHAGVKAGNHNIDGLAMFLGVESKILCVVAQTESDQCSEIDSFISYLFVRESDGFQ